jgi:hypothetical protein
VSGDAALQGEDFARGAAFDEVAGELEGRYTSELRLVCVDRTRVPA